MKQTDAEIALELLTQEPIEDTSGLRVHVAADVFELWQRWERVTGRPQPTPYWAVVWPGAMLMARWLRAHPAAVRGRRVVDIGCGSGVGALTAACCGASSVLANDLDLTSLAVCEFTARLNGLQIQTSAADLADPDSAVQSFDVLLICEMFYEAAASERLASWLAHQRKRGSTILIADGERPFLPRQHLQILDEQVLPTNFELEGVEERRVSLYQWV